MKENLTNVTIVAIVAIVLLGVLAVSAFAITGMAASKVCSGEIACNDGFMFSKDACKCIRVVKGKSDQVHECQIFCQIGVDKTIILEEKFYIDGSKRNKLYSPEGLEFKYKTGEQVPEETVENWINNYNGGK